MKVIGLCGPKQSGKDTTLGFLKKYLPEIKQTALADKLKNVCSGVFEIDRTVFDNQSLKEVPFSIFGRKISFDGFVMSEILTQFGIESAMQTEYCKLDTFMEKFSGMQFISARHIAQFVGTEILRNFGSPDIHCLHLKKELNKNPNGLYCITDIRFNNELDFLSRELGSDFISFYIQRPSAEESVTKLSHISERETLVLKTLSDDIITNEGTPEDLEKNVESFVKNIRTVLRL